MQWSAMGFLQELPIFESLAAHLYPVVFFGALVDASGIPFPGRLLLIAAGALSHAGQGHLAVVIGLTMIAAMTMDHAWYFASRASSQRLLGLYRRLTGFSGRRGDPVIDYFVRYGAATIVLGRFSTAVRALAWPAAASHGIGYVKFLLLDLVGAGVWASLWVGLGWSVGLGWRSAGDAAGAWVMAGTALLVAVAAAPLVIHLWRRRAARGSVAR